jgi:NAD(P)-dependent dehydrogenase (short-subunit alcohol dehydrogenase family)
VTEELDFTGRTVLVTGAGRNIGRACALEFAHAGANVVVNARSNEAEAEQVAKEVREAGGNAVVAMGDVGDPSAVDTMARTAFDAFGGVDVYVSCAAVRRRQALLDITDEDWQSIISTNLSASFYLARRFVPGMIERGWGRVLHISGHDGFWGSSNRAHNVTAKQGLHGLTKAMAKELGCHGITVNTVVAGSFDTTRDPVQYPHWSLEARARANPLGRIGDPSELAWLCRFLAATRSGYLNGQAFHINGGENVY